jgi:TetR/AcrR family transcriptional regulator, fatty acid metabolism regulator protein
MAWKGFFAMEQAERATAPRSLKERQRQEREELILQVAEEVFTESGYEASMDEIATRVGIAKGTVYLHFPSKEDLVFAIIQRDIQQLMVKTDEVISSDLSAQSKIEAILLCMYGGIFAKRMRIIASLINSFDSQRQFKEQGKKLSGLWERLATSISSVLDQGKAAGEFALDIPTPIMLNAFFSLLSPRSYVQFVVEGKMTEDELAKYLGRIYFQGITKNL